MSEEEEKSEVGRPKSEEAKGKRSKAKGTLKTESEQSALRISQFEINKSEIEHPKSEIQDKTDPDSYRDEHPESEIKEPLTTHNSPLTNMEVHHHPEVEKKGFKEYILEGLMIFLAVTMGFFAESLREHIADKEKETQYMHAMIIDLGKDTIAINAEIVYTNQLIYGLDSLFKCLHSKELTDSVQLKLYQLTMKYNRLIGFEFSDAASTQLKNTGGIRLIQSQEVTNGIIHYWQASQISKENADVYNLKVSAFWEESYKIFDFAYVKIVSNRKAGILNIQVDPYARLLTKDKLQLTEFANRVRVLVFSLQGWYVSGLEKQKAIESNLCRLINNNYKF